MIKPVTMKPSTHRKKIFPIKKSNISRMLPSDLQLIKLVLLVFARFTHVNFLGIKHNHFSFIRQGQHRQSDKKTNIQVKTPMEKPKPVEKRPRKIGPPEI
jgi:hypothetical protein